MVRSDVQTARAGQSSACLLWYDRVRSCNDGPRSSDLGFEKYWKSSFGPVGSTMSEAVVLCTDGCVSSFFVFVVCTALWKVYTVRRSCSCFVMSQ